MSLLDTINKLCVDVDAEMRAQHSELQRAQQRRQVFPLQPDWVLQLHRCPDWPDERVQSYAAQRASWCAADIAEDGLGGRIGLQEAVWLLLQDGGLPEAVLQSFLVGCAEHALAYADAAMAGESFEQSQHLQPRANWPALTSRYRQLAIALDKERIAKGGSDRLAWIVFRASRVAGYAMPGHHSTAHRALMASRLEAICCPGGVLPGRRRQLVHLRELVT